MSEKHPAAAAWDAWLASPEGESCRRAATLHAPPKMDHYLENRLRAAFLAGYHGAVDRLADEVTAGG